MTMKLGETGVTFRVNTGFDMSSYTDLSIVFIKPGGTTVTKTTADGVTLGTIAVANDPDLGALTANEYMEYEIESGLLDTAGTWKVYGIYTNTVPSPTDSFIGKTRNVTIQDPAKLN